MGKKGSLSTSHRPVNRPVNVSWGGWLVDVNEGYLRLLNGTLLLSICLYRKVRDAES